MEVRFLSNQMNRLVVTMVLIVLATYVLVLVHAKDVTTLEYDVLPVTETNARLRVDTDALVGDNRQARTSLHTELPSSKAKREQALRNILAARRRQILGPRPVELSRNLNRSLRRGESSMKDSSDTLEAQETKHGLYVTAPANIKAESLVEEDAPPVILEKIIIEAASDDRNIEFISSEAKPMQADEQTSRNPCDENFMPLSIECKPAPGNSRSNYSIGHKNSSSLSFSQAPSSFMPSSQKISDTENRKKNTVAMPESLYNYFRPVESNIPVEDMSQFLYFGQKLQPEVHNTTANNSVEVTPTAPTAPSSRRRYSMKRFSTTTAVPVPRLEEIINEEMNIAVERQTVEKNKVPKIKNAFRSPENGLYYRKTRPTDPTIASNVILMKEPDRNSSETDERQKLLGDKFRDDNPSAHATIQDQLQHERGSAATHVLAEKRNATNSTQIPYHQPVSANMYEESIVESEITLKDRQMDTSNESLAVSNGLPNIKTSHSYPRRRKTDNSSVSSDAKVTKPDNRSADSKDDTKLEDAESTKYTDLEMHADHSEQKVTMANMYDANVAFDFSQKTDSPPITTHPRSSNNRESNNIETSTTRTKTNRFTTESAFPIPWNSASAETSTLRIIVTEGNLEQSSLISADFEEKYTVKPVDSLEKRVRTAASGHHDIPTTKALPSATTVFTTNMIEPNPPGMEATTVAQPESRGEELDEEHRGNTKKPQNPSNQQNLENQKDQSDATEEQQEQRQNIHEEQHHRHQEQPQHVYAYTITNVTRLLRNYTGPGLSREEQGGPRQSSGTAEITTGSSSQRRPPPPPSLLLPRTGSGIEAARAPAELSAGTTIEAVAAGGTSIANAVGERQRKLVAVSTQSLQRALNRTSVQLPVNKSTPRSGKTAEVAARGAVRWNHTKARNSDLEGLSDRRFLRKSASAVLNQRIEGTVDEDASVTSKRRRLVHGQNLFVGARRFKGLGAAAGDTSSPSSLDTGEGDFVGERILSSLEDVEEKRTVQETMVFGGTNRGIEAVIPDSMMIENTTARGIKDSNGGSVSNSMERTIDTYVTTPRIFTDIMDEDGSNLSESVSLTSETVETDTKDKNAPPSESESVGTSGNVAPDSSAISADNATDNGRSSSTVTVTESVDETIVPKETVLSTTTMPTPVFPVTPKIITEAARVSTAKETFTLKPAEAANQTQAEAESQDTNKPSKPFGVANLDPSEIQKMYRSKNVTSTGVPILSSTTTESTTTLSQRQSTLHHGNNKTVTATDPPVESRKRLSGERSPEVRARNLSDKSKDKDDILPIMQLYNTSDIFNGSGSRDSLSRGTEHRFELPADSKQVTSSTTAAEVNVMVTSETPINEGSSSSGAPLTEPTRKTKHDENREAPSQVPPTGPGRGSSFVNGSGNRTRKKPSYHQTILPEYNSSVYPDELNRTFFETGLISVSPRESVNISEVISKRHDGDAIASQETVAVVSYILATLVVFPIAVGVGLILRRLILRNRKVLEESDTSSEISCRKDALNLENGDFKTSIEKAITKLPRIQHLCHEAEKPPPPSSPESRWEFPRDKLRLQTVLGQGNFGQVWKAEADDLTGHQGTTRLVAVKTVKEGASDREKEDLVRELEIMQQLGSHPNVVTLLGCCTEEEPHYLILEYVMYGKLLAYLRDHRTRQDFYNFSEDSAALTSRDLTVFGYCVARGMEYLASKKIIHRDLAARNVLVDHNKLCKIADFGMSRFANEDGEVIETRHGRNALPIRWMAPESLIYSLFTTKTDVWSFGILMWEIVTLGSTPYPDMTAREVMRNVQSGYRLERPSHCRSELFRVISRCWHDDPDRRPEFQTLRRDLAQLLEDNMNGHYVDLESFASECTD